MNITLKPEEEQLIQEKLKTGKYETAYDVIVDALSLLEERDTLSQEWLEETRKKVAVGIAQLNQGEGIDGEVVIARLREKLCQPGENQV
ncbi:MAG: type II toxin-antitoxin system ParD family antitoxin [Symploca sp. SIO2E6]|nr:type II toxin-antitoxin system ParD family antitoxin [Symploca sp. SIO2E6]